MYGRNGQLICLLSPFFCPSSKIAQPKYAKSASERARSASVHGIFFYLENFTLDKSEVNGADFHSVLCPPKLLEN